MSQLLCYPFCRSATATACPGYWVCVEGMNTSRVRCGPPVFARHSMLPARCGTAVMLWLRQGERVRQATWLADELDLELSSACRALQGVL